RGAQPCGGHRAIVGMSRTSAPIPAGSASRAACRAASAASPCAGCSAGRPAAGVGTSGALQTTPQEEHLVDFVDAVAGDVQDTWQQILGGRYERTKVVLFRDVFESGCGAAESATGPFYCPDDHKVYLDLGFFRELSDRFGAPGDFAQAYVIAHEFGHHVQNLLGISERVRGSRTGPHSGSVALELQADCYAG